MTVAAREERVYPDGRHELTEEASMALSDSSLYNEDLAPVAVERRTWTTYNYLALWVGMAHNIPTWLLASGLIALGMDWVQAILTIAVANIVVLVPMLLNSHAGTKYGSPTRSSPAPPSASLAPTCRPCCAPGSPAAGSGSRPGSAAARCTCCWASCSGTAGPMRRTSPLDLGPLPHSHGRSG
jgi:hypothetical protein